MRDPAWEVPERWVGGPSLDRPPPVRPGTAPYREPHPVRLAAILGGAAAGTFWLWLWAEYAPAVLGRGGGLAVGVLLGAAASVGLALRGDRGAAVGLALGVAAGGTIMVIGTLVFAL